MKNQKNSSKRISVSNEKSQVHLLVEKIQELEEQDLVNDFLLPLFREIGFDIVDNYGGPYEIGKDIILWRTDEIGCRELVVAQVKKYKSSPSSSDKQAFGALITQLQQACEEDVPSIEGRMCRPAFIYFITPYPIDTRSLQSRFQKYSSLRQSRLKIIDGPQLAKLIWEKLPEKASDILGDSIIFDGTTIANLNNKELMSALGEKSAKDLHYSYSELEFSIGRITTKFFFSLKFKPTKMEIGVSETDWKLLKPRCKFVENYFGLKILTSSYEKIEQFFQLQKQIDKNIVETNKLIDEVVLKCSVELTKLDKKIKIILESIKKSLEIEISKRDKCKEDKRKEDIRKEKATLKILKNYNFRMSANIIKKRSDNTFQILHNQVNDICNILSKVVLVSSHYEDISLLHQKYISIIKPFLQLEFKVGDFKKRKKGNCIIVLDGNQLASKLMEEQKLLREQIKKINKTNPTISFLKSFLLSCKELFNNTDYMLSHPDICQAIGIQKDQKLRYISDTESCKISINKIFDTKLDLVLLGEAGAGKTTTLQMYFENKRKIADNHELVIYSPLSRVISALGNDPNKTKYINPLELLERAISCFLSEAGIKNSHTKFIKALSEQKVLLMLDGVDEVIHKSPWILEGIKALKERYPKVQIIISSRMSGSYISEIPFLGITLLPFNDKQRLKFINGWFKSDTEKKAQQIIKHLEEFENLAEIVRNPLLATILCVLADRGIKLPKSELRLYEERMRLLLGQYDIHKKSTRIESHRNDLEIVSRKLAYQLHYKGLRYAPKNQLTTFVTKALYNLDKGKEAVLAIQELIDPCNILIPMTEDGQLGFGHLRYQEYLVACELNYNRKIDIFPFLNRDWWFSALVLFAQMSDNIDFIFEKLLTYDSFLEFHETLKKLIFARPEREQKELLTLLQNKVEMEEDLSNSHIEFSQNSLYEEKDWCNNDSDTYLEGMEEDLTPEGLGYNEIDWESFDYEDD